MSDQKELPGAAGRDSPPAGMPTAEALQAPEPQQMVSSVLEEFSRWLERWTVYVRARAALVATGEEGMPAAQAAPSLPGSPLPAQSPPAHWQTAATQSPPAHWLALFSGQPPGPTFGEQPAKLPEIPPASQRREPAGSTAEVIQRFQADLADFLGTSQPSPAPTESRPAFTPLEGSAIRAESTARTGTSPHPEAGSVPIQPGPISYLEEPLPEAPGVTPAASSRLEAPPSPPSAGPAPARVTQFHQRLSPARRPATAISSPGLASENQADSLATDLTQLHGSPDQMPTTPGMPESPPAQPKVTRLRLGGPHRVGLLDNRDLATAAGPPPAEALPAEPNAISAPVQPPAQIQPEPAAEPAVASIVQPQPAPARPDLPVQLTSAEGSSSPSMMVEAAVAEPAFPEPPLHAEPLPVRWPPNNNLPYWPDLPQPLPPHDPGPSPHQDPARRRRIDREQGGSLWNG